MSAGASPVATIRGFTGPGFGQNGYVVSCPITRKAVLVDPGAAVDGMLSYVREEGLDVQAILLTHAHVDHIEGVARVRETITVPIHLHPNDEGMYTYAPQQAQMFGMELQAPPPIDEYLSAGESIRVGEVKLEVRHTPGHAPGHVILVGLGVAIVGDCVFAGSIGRTDLPGGDFQTLMSSIRREILSLPGETVLYPGHGPETTVGHERDNNPFLASQFGGSGFA